MKKLTKYSIIGFCVLLTLAVIVLAAINIHDSRGVFLDPPRHALKK